MAKRHEATKRAATFIGVVEHPAGSNRGPQVSKWIQRATGLNGGIPWCACFVWCMFDDVGRKITNVEFPASVLSWVETAQKHGWAKKRPWRGHLVAFSWSGHDPTPDDHIGFVEKVLALPRKRNGSLSWHYYIKTVEGNTGDGVYRRWRWVHPLDVVFIEVPDFK